jgi:hypothetical protein
VKEDRQKQLTRAIWRNRLPSWRSIAFFILIGGLLVPFIDGYRLVGKTTAHVLSARVWRSDDGNETVWVVESVAGNVRTIKPPLGIAYVKGLEICAEIRRGWISGLEKVRVTHKGKC